MHARDAITTMDGRGVTSLPRRERSSARNVSVSNIEAMNYDYEEAHRRHLSLAQPRTTSSSKQMRHTALGNGERQQHLPSATRHSDGRLKGSPSANIPASVSARPSTGSEGSGGSGNRKRESSVRGSVQPSAIRTSTRQRSSSTSYQQEPDPRRSKDFVFLGHTSMQLGNNSLGSIEFDSSGVNGSSGGRNKPHTSTNVRRNHMSMSSLDYIQERTKKVGSADYRAVLPPPTEPPTERTVFPPGA